MCGIIGYTGEKDALERVTEGLFLLEYRGYDSAGIAAELEDGICVVKRCGRVAELAAALHMQGPTRPSHCAIGHTRWATHGGVTEKNAHPHTVGHVTLVHNGIIENEKSRREELCAAGVPFHSDTDTEVAAALIDRAYRHAREPVAALRQALTQMTGSYAFAILFDDRPGEIYAVRRDSPLLFARTADGALLASDLAALLPYTQSYAVPKEGEILCLQRQRILLYPPEGEPYAPTYESTVLTHTAAERGGYESFMEKEMEEQPAALAAALRGRTGEALQGEEAVAEELLCRARRLHLVACGSAMHAALLAALFFEREAGLPCEVRIASEYRYHMPPVDRDTLLLVISQSGETADTLAAMREARARALPCLAIVNVENSSIAREADAVLYTHAGPEIAVATTKGYSTQLALLLTLSLLLARKRGRISEQRRAAEVAALLSRAPSAMAAVLAKKELLSSFAASLTEEKSLFYIGRGQDYALAMEGSLKLKEISYLHSEAYAAGELKHGTISLIESKTPVVALCTDRTMAQKMAGNVREVISRGARVLLLCREDCLDAFPHALTAFPLPCESEGEVIFAAVAAMQRIAYQAARYRGCDIDHPRNLAKSVTVE